jgi:hypothetical protein
MNKKTSQLLFFAYIRFEKIKKEKVFFVYFHILNGAMNTE